MDPVTCTFAHVNIIARDWRRLAAFYEEVFGCRPVPPARSVSAPWLARCTGVRGAELEGIHLRLPGRGEDGPTLEIFQYSEVLDGPAGARANRRGLGHLAFAVEDVPAALARLGAAGGAAVGEVVQTEVAGVGRLEVVYAADPEGNLVELQRWL
jgi:predicted enzyme related to lactoylglutathione lyase